MSGINDLICLPDISVDVAIKKIQCSCGKSIEYNDRVVGGSNAAKGVLICSKCGKENEITFFGFLSEIKGASLKK